MIQRSTFLLGVLSLLFQNGEVLAGDDNGGAMTLTISNFEEATDGKSVFIKVSHLHSEFRR